MRRLSCVASVAVLLLTWVAGAVAAEPLSVDLVLKAGRPFRVALDRKILVRRVGQAVTGTVVEAVYAYRSDRHSCRDEGVGAHRATRRRVSHRARTRGSSEETCPRPCRSCWSLTR